MAIRAVNYPNGLFAIQNTIPKIDLQDPGLERVCGDIKLFWGDSFLLIRFLDISGFSKFT